MSDEKIEHIPRSRSDVFWSMFGRGGDSASSKAKGGMHNILSQSVLEAPINENDNAENFLVKSMKGMMSRSVLISDEQIQAAKNTQDISRDMRFMSQEEWQLSVSCYVCKKLFSRLVGSFRHHCRLCAQSVCSECSTKKISDQRVCDVCYVKSVDTEAEIKREKYTSRLDERISRRQQDNQELKNQYESINKDIASLAIKAREDIERLIATAEAYEAEVEKAEAVKAKKQKHKTHLEATVVSTEEQTHEKTIEFNDLEMKSKVGKVRLQEIEVAYLNKTDAYRFLTFRKERLEETRSSSPHLRSGSVMSPSRSFVHDFTVNPNSPAHSRSVLIPGEYSDDANVRYNTAGAYTVRQPSILANTRDSYKEDTPQSRAPLCGAGFGQCYN